MDLNVPARSEGRRLRQERPGIRRRLEEYPGGRVGRTAVSRQTKRDVKVDVGAERELEREAVVVPGGEEAGVPPGEDPLLLGLEGRKLVSDGIECRHRGL